MALQLRRETHESIIYIDKDSAPRIMPAGEDFKLIYFGGLYGTYNK
ncbi:MAG TPA: hypothetical protein PKE69_18605 [Pyrinomonadaceae bacterium]|nr:hypothetical protein [Pyrinomonadaceae bacterium]